MIFERLLRAASSSSSIEITSSGSGAKDQDQMAACRLFSRELQLFAESEQRRTMLNRVVGETSLLNGHCYTQEELVRFVMATTVEDVDDRSSSCSSLQRGYADGSDLYLLRLNAVGEDLLSESVAWVSDRSCKNMGLPWGFTIMALN